MKETTFIKQNKKKWARFEKLSGQKNNDPDEVAELFTEITEDLSYARTFYPRRSVRVYLNQLAQGVFTSLYKQRKQPIGNFLKFWTVTLPLEVYRARHNLLTAFLFFAVAIVIGAVSQHYNPDFAKLVLGDYYVEATEQRILEGNPMGIYGESQQSGMFVQITLNNIRVAFIAFVSGIFLTLGTYVVLLGNGIMLGCFQWWFKTKGLLLTSFLAIWIHGAFEISSIVIAGAAGITLGNGILFPRSYSRVQSLIFSAKRGLTILLSLIPFFIIAGFLESYVTRHYQTMPDGMKWLIILFSFAVIILYYVVFPFVVARKHPDKIAVKEIPRFIPDRKIEWNRIRKVAEVFTDTFYLFIKYSRNISRIFFTLILPLALVLTAVIFAIEFYKFDYDLTMIETFRTLFGTGVFFTWYKFLGWSLILALLFLDVFYVIQADEDAPLFKGYFKFLLRHLVWMYLFALGAFSIFVFAPFYLLLLSILVAPFIGMIPAIIVHERKDFFTAFGNSFSLGKGAYGDSLGSFTIFILIYFIFSFILENPIGGGFGEFDIISLIDGVIKDLTITVFDRYAVIISFVNCLLFLLFLFLMIGIYALSFSLSYYSSNEIKTAKGMYDKLGDFGKRNKQFETDLDYD
ncbi:MAG: stage II sporulation protein M [Crocinitomicaceae bacterium]|nr:stage II sporulation protein M [Crocinitomicaceae bacterium]